MILVWPRQRDRRAIGWRVLGLFAAAGLGSVFWTTVVVLVAGAWNLQVGGGAIFGFGLAVGALSFLGAALVTAGCRSD
jgi:hypothetical protein